MSRIQVRSFREPDETLTPPLGKSAIVRIGEVTVERGVLQPGWSWRQHGKPIVRTEWCRFHHRGVVLSGQLGIRMDDGEEAIIGPDSVFDVPPGHDGWVVGDEPLVTIDWAGVEGWASPPAEGERMLATLLFTDIVDSTTLARRLGDAAWTRTRGLHDETVRSVLSRFRGREVETAGDSFLAVFNGAARAVRCARRWSSRRRPSTSLFVSASTAATSRSAGPEAAGAWPSTLPPGCSRWPRPARSSSRVRPATLRRGRACASRPAAGTSLRAWRANASFFCSPRYRRVRRRVTALTEDGVARRDRRSCRVAARLCSRLLDPSRQPGAWACRRSCISERSGESQFAWAPGLGLRRARPLLGRRRQGGPPPPDLTRTPVRVLSMKPIGAGDT